MNFTTKNVMIFRKRGGQKMSLKTMPASQVTYLWSVSLYKSFVHILILKSRLSPKEDVKMLVMNPYVTQIYKCLVSRNCLTSDRTQRFCFFPELLTKLQITKEILMNIANVECIVYSYKYNTKSSFRHILCNLIDWFSYQNKKYIGEHLTKWNFLIYV